MIGGYNADEIAETADCALRWLHVDHLARFILNADRSILWLNPAAQRLLENCPDLDVREQKLAVSDRLPSAAFLAFLAEVDRNVRTFTLPCADGDGHLLFQARRISEQGQPLRVGLCVHQTGSNYEPRYADFSAAFGLTGREVQVLLQLLNGQRAEDISEQNACSLETVRTHIRNIYVKLNVSTREQLFFRLRPFRIN